MIRDDLFKHIPFDTEKVLDIGCDGCDGHEYLKEDRRVKHYVGLDRIDTPERIELMKQRSDRYVIHDLDQSFKYPFQDREFDVIVFGDVLEHLKNPWRVLREIQRHLKDDGIIIVSLPNTLNHYKSFRRIVTNTTQYENAGLWDITHFRFFTHLNRIGLFQQAGLKVFKEDHNYEYDPWIYEKKDIMMALFNQILQYMCFGSNEKNTLRPEDMETFFIIQHQYVLKKDIKELPEEKSE